jgi:hypothetical protein
MSPQIPEQLPERDSPEDLAEIREIDRLAELSLMRAQGRLPSVSFGSKQNGASQEFRTLPDPLPAVPELDPALIPAALRPWVADIADGMQVAVEFVAVPVIVACAGVIGRQVGIALKQNERWIERCILWGAVIGRPSSGKSPALRPAQRMLTRLESERRDAWQKEVRSAEVNSDLLREERALARKTAQASLKAGDRKAARDALDALEDSDEAPPEPRIVVNDCTIEKLGEILNGNPRGLVQFRDELAGWLASLDRDGREGDRGFWLEGWNGVGPYTCDRIGRGTVRIEAPAVSILGGVQPGKLAEYVRGAVKGGLGDDGLLQRFQMAVYPDVPPSWRYVDRAPEPSAELSAWNVFSRLDRLDPQLIGAEQHPAVDVPYLRLSPDAQALFVEFQTALMLRLREGREPPHMESHLAKYPALAGRLALTLHLIDHNRGPVEIEALAAALDWCEYLEPHARRIYAPATDNGISAAHLLAKRRGDLPAQFTARDIYRKGWSGLDRDSVEGALEVLVEYGHLAEFDLDTGGRPTSTYVWRES